MERSADDGGNHLRALDRRSELWVIVPPLRPGSCHHNCMTLAMGDRASLPACRAHVDLSLGIPRGRLGSGAPGSTSGGGALPTHSIPPATTSLAPTSSPTRGGSVATVLGRSDRNLGWYMVNFLPTTPSMGQLGEQSRCYVLSTSCVIVCWGRKLNETLYPRRSQWLRSRRGRRAEDLPSRVKP